MESSNNNIYKSEVSIDPLDVYLEEAHKWLTCGHILVHIDNFNYLIECTKCKVRFKDNDLFLKHLRDNHNEIFTKAPSLKKECELDKLGIVEDSQSDCKSLASEYNCDNELSINNTEYKELPLDKAKSESKNSKKENQSKSRKTSKKLSPGSNKKVNVSQDIQDSNIKEDAKTKSDKEKEILEKQGIPYNLRVPVNETFQCSDCPSKFKKFTALRNHFWLKHTYKFKIVDEKCVPNLPENSPNSDDNLYHCTACLARYTLYETLLNHFSRHPGANAIQNKPHKCSYCNLSFWTKFLLKSHELVHTRERPFKCEICTKGFIRKENLVSHTRIHTNDRKFKCSYCDKRFYVKLQKETHELIHLGLKPHVCEKCGVGFRKKSALSYHMRRRHNDDTVLKCNVCSESFTDYRLLRQHKLIHKDKEEMEKIEIKQKEILEKDGIPYSLRTPVNGIYQCSECTSNFKQFNALRKHYWLKHTYQIKLDDENCVPNLPENSPNPDDNCFHCTACLARFSQYEALLGHFRYHPGASLIENKPFKCLFCNASFWTQLLKKTHELVHTRERPFKCEICSRGFIRKENLVSHTLTHTDNKKYKCDFCDKRFFVRSQRKTHELIHLGLKPHICDVCGSGFRKRSALTLHMRRHTGEKLSQCKVCKKTFFDNRLLSEHVLIHSDEKKFNCEICERKFTTKKHLKNHQKLHSDVRSYICDICNKGFKQHAGLYSHMKCFHGQVKTTAESGDT